MRVAVAGSSGFVGAGLRAELAAAGHDVVRLVRRPAAADDEITWDPDAGRLDSASLAGVEAVVNLCGAGVGDRRWTRHYKRVIHDSRVRSTAVLASALAAMTEPPRVFVSGSAEGYYGNDRGRLILDENDPPGETFLARLCVDWEAAAAPAKAAGIAVCHPRLGIVMHRSGGALGRMLPLFRFGLGGRLGGGEQFWSFVSRADTTRALRFLVEEHGCVGAYNVTAPQPAANAEFARVLAEAMKRPALVPAPSFAVQVVLGEYADEVLGSLRIVPSRLLDSGFTFEHPDARSVVAAALAPAS